MLVKPKLLFLTNFGNDEPLEDQALIELLRADFDLVVSHPLYCLNLLGSADGVLVRNIWPTHEYRSGWNAIESILRKSSLPVYNPLGFNGDFGGKDYLLELYDLGYPVIPSIDSVDNLYRLQDSEYYWIKPKFSCDGVGAEKLTKEELLKISPIGYIIQPFLEFECEPSFFFVDNQYNHSLCAIHRLSNADMHPYEASENDLMFADQFVRWVSMPYGTQRIDSIRLASGQLLLTEVENFCPYLYISDMDEAMKRDFLSVFRRSILKIFQQPGKRAPQNPQLGNPRDAQSDCYIAK
jgi:hypothetical protein